MLTLLLIKSNIKKNVSLKTPNYEKKGKNIKKTKLSIEMLKALKKINGLGYYRVSHYQLVKLKKRGYLEYASLTQKSKKILGFFTT